MFKRKTTRYVVVPNSIDQADLLAHVETLERTLDQLALALTRRAQSFAWVHGQERKERALLAAAAAYRCLSYSDEQGATETTSLAGLIGVDQQTLEAVHAVNAAKDRLRTCTQRFRGRYVEQPREDRDGVRTPPAQYTPYLRYLLSRIGRARMNTLQAYRHIQIVERPDHAGFTWAHIRKVARVEREKLLRMLEEHGEDEQAFDDIARVEAVRDPVFALVTGPVLQIRANLIYPDQHDRPQRQVNVAMPIVYHAQVCDPPPRITPLPTDPEEGKRSRKAQRLQQERYLESLNVFRYRTDTCVMPGGRRD
jgi:hypothetical protein